MSVRKRIGVMVPSTNTSFEADFQLVSPRDVTIHGQRLWLTNDAMGAAGMDRMNAEVESGARYLATARVDVVAYGCTTGSFYRGPGWDREMLDIIQKAAGVPAVATSPSVVEALRSFGARKVSVATPYPDWNNKQLRAYLEALGFEVLNVEGEPHAAAGGNQDINDHDPEEVVAFASRVCRPEADALLCSCTAWRSLEAVAELEQRTGKPVVSSNQASIWAAYRAHRAEAEDHRLRPAPGEPRSLADHRAPRAAQKGPDARRRPRTARGVLPVRRARGRGRQRSRWAFFSSPLVKISTDCPCETSLRKWLSPNDH